MDQAVQQLEQKQSRSSEATQINVTAQNEVFRSTTDQDSLQLKRIAEQWYNQAMEEIKLMDAGHTTYINSEPPEDVDERAVISQQQDHFKMLEKEFSQLRQLQKHSKAHSREIHRLKQQQGGFVATGSASDECHEIVPEDKDATINFQKELISSDLTHQEELMQKDYEIKKLKEDLKNVKTERDNLQQQNSSLFAFISDYKGLEAEVSATRETITFLAEQVAAKATEASDLKEETEALQKEIDDLKRKLEARILEAQQYEKDFRMERSEKENMAGRIDDQRAKIHIQLQQLRGKMESVKNQLEHEQENSITLEVEKANLEAELIEQEVKINKLEHSLQACKTTCSQLQRTQKQLDTQLKPHIQQRQPLSPLYNEKALDRYVVRPRRSIKFDTKIGEGCYGSVYAISLNGTPCIAKRLQDILMGRNREETVSQEVKENFHRNFFRECVLLSQTNHPNIVKFIGVLYARDKYDLTLILEQLATDLQRFLARGANIPLSTKLSILHDVSCGLLYLHERSIIHRDLFAGNILLTTDSRAKIADLGVSRIFDRSISELSKLPGTLGYMPPEALKDRSFYNESIDIFSFGVLALFVAIQEFPEFSWKNVPDALLAKGEGEIYKRSSWIVEMNTKQPELSSLVLWCLQDDPMKRPRTFTLNTLLNEMRKDYPI